MLYKKSREVPANTAIASPDRQTLQVAKGQLTHWLVVCPDECADLMKFKVLYHNVQLFPFSRDEWADALIGSFPIPESIEIDTAPYVLDIVAYNLDDTYNHEYNIYVNIIPEKPFKPPAPGFDLRRAWNGLFGGGT